MIIYQSTKAGFLRDHDNNDIADVINASFFKRTNRYVPHNEFRAWHNSLSEMAKVLRDDGIPDEVGIGVEYGIPQSSMRIDFVLSGLSEERDPLAVIVELKQWSNSKISEKDGIVIARRGGTSEREGPHPSYQAWSYAMLLRGFNEAVYEGNVELKPCAYLHNYVDDHIISSPHYEPYTKLAPLFLKGDLQKLKEFVKTHVRHGDNGDLLYTIDRGRIRPSKLLADSVGKMLKGNQEFILVDDQKVAYETVLALAKSADALKKRVVIIRGGPGTGKSVIAINLVAALTKLGMNTKYVS